MKFIRGEGPEELIGFLKSLIGEGDDSGKTVLEEIPMKTNWLTLKAEFDTALEEKRKAEAKAETLKKLFWSTIEAETGLFNNQMKYDHDKQVIVVYATDDDKARMTADAIKGKTGKKKSE